MNNNIIHTLRGVLISILCDEVVNIIYEEIESSNGIEKPRIEKIGWLLVSKVSIHTSEYNESTINQNIGTCLIRLYEKISSTKTSFPKKNILLHIEALLMIFFGPDPENNFKTPTYKNRRPSLQNFIPEKYVKALFKIINNKDSLYFQYPLFDKRIINNSITLNYKEFDLIIQYYFETTYDYNDKLIRSYNRFIKYNFGSNKIYTNYYYNKLSLELIIILEAININNKLEVNKINSKNGEIIFTKGKFNFIDKINREIENYLDSSIKSDQASLIKYKKQLNKINSKISNIIDSDFYLDKFYHITYPNETIFITNYKYIYIDKKDINSNNTSSSYEDVRNTTPKLEALFENLVLKNANYVYDDNLFS